MLSNISDLRRSQLFSGADEALLRRCSKLFSAYAFRKGRRLFFQGETSHFVHLISTGHVRLSCFYHDGHEISLAIVGPGDPVGEEALTGEARRRLMATALDDCTTLAASAESLIQIFNMEPALAMNLAKYASFRCSGVSVALEDAARGRVRDRLLRALRRLASEYGIASETGRQIGLRLTHADIATFVGKHA